MDMRLFLKRLAVFTFLSVIFLGFLSYFLLKNNNADYQLLYKYQLNKIRQADNVSTLLIGDSSLGNAIDNEEFAKLSSQATINCALTGLYGYAGSYNILKTAHKYHPEIKNVIIMQTLDMQTRPVSYDGYVRTAHTLDDFIELSNTEKFIFFKELYYYIKSIRLVDLVGKEDLIQNDYIKQGPKNETAHITKALSPNKINPDKNKFLTKIVDYGLDNDLNIIYINGPVYEEKEVASESYINTVNKIISKTGIRMIYDMVDLKKDDLGDNEDHVRPELKKEYTKKYYELVREYLK